MSHWQSRTFWGSALIGWFVTMFALATFISIFGSEEMTTAEGVAVNIAEQLLSLAAGYAYGRRQFDLRKAAQIGFPVITRGDDHSAAG